MSDLAAQLNATLDAETPVLARALSPLGRRVFMPRDIPVQAQEAKGKTYNATIGQITDGKGSAVPLPSMAAAFSGLSDVDRTAAFLYSPVPGIPEVRERWRQWQRRALPAGREGVASSLPVVTAGLTHGLSVAADLFAADGRLVLIPSPFWGNYKQTFTTRIGARIAAAPAYEGGRFNVRVFEEALAGAEPPAAGEPIVALLNLPSNPGGYSLTDEERAGVARSLCRLAEERPVVVICDDSYAGLVFEDDISPASMFWDLAGRHPNLVPIKVDGATKEFSFFGGRVGFVTFPVAAGTPAAQALEAKAAGLVRAAAGSPVAASQVVLLQALRREDVVEQVEAVRRLLAERYRALRDALATVDPGLLVPLPFNSGCFALLELGPEVAASAEDVRQHLLAHLDTGVVSIGQRHVRIAFCSLGVEALAELVRRVERGVAELAGRVSVG